MWAIEDSPGPNVAYLGGGIILLPGILLEGSTDEVRNKFKVRLLLLQDKYVPIFRHSNKKKEFSYIKQLKL